MRQISSDRTTNNTRAILWDEAGQFDSVAKPEGYLGTMGGVVRRSTSASVFTGDTKTMHLWDSNLLVTRQVLPDAVDLIQVASGVTTHDEKVIVPFKSIELGEGPAPALSTAWVIVNRVRLALLCEDGTLQTIAASLDGSFSWEAAAAAAPPHALAGDLSTVYVLESNRTLGTRASLAL